MLGARVMDCAPEYVHIAWVFAAMMVSGLVCLGIGFALAVVSGVQVVD